MGTDLQPMDDRELKSLHPEKTDWLELMNMALGKLTPVSFGDSLTENVEPDVARQEFLSGGQEVGHVG